jgi:rubrerythrin
MYSDKDLIRILRKNLDYELDVIKFYLDNLEGINYSANKKSVRELVLDSHSHALMISKRLLDLQEKTGGKLRRGLQDKAYREEHDVREIYLYELGRTSNPFVAKVLKRLVKEEKRHESIVKRFK